MFIKFSLVIFVIMFLKLFIDIVGNDYKITKNMSLVNK
jgi:hypothetical protein